MAGAFITATPSGFDEVTQLLQQLYERTGDISAPLADIGEMLLSSHRDRWRAEQAPDGTPWLPLAPETVEAKGQDFILREHDLLRDLLNYNVEPLALYFGTPQSYGEYHQDGRGVPQRQWLGVSDRDRQGAMSIVSEYLLADLGSE